MFSKEFGAKDGVTVSDKCQIQVKKSTCCHKNPEAATVGIRKRKACKGQHRFFPVNVVEFSRTAILRNISGRLLLKISTSVANYYPFKPFSILNFAVTECFCYVSYFEQDFSVTAFYFITRIKWDVVISSSLRLMLKVWIRYRCQNRVESYYLTDGDQLGFYKKVISKRRAGGSCNLYITRNEEFKFMWQKLYPRKRQMPYST